MMCSGTVDSELHHDAAAAAAAVIDLPTSQTDSKHCQVSARYISQTALTTTGQAHQQRASFSSY